VAVTSLTVIGADTLVRGDIQSSQALEIVGRVEGNVSSEGEIAIAETGSVLGSVSGSRVVVSGAVEGNLKGSELVAVEARGRVVGDLIAPSVSVAVGAWVRGEVRTAGETSLTSRRGATPKARAGSSESALATAVPKVSELRSKSVRPPVDQLDQEVVTPRRPTPIVPAAYRDHDEAPETPRPSEGRQRPPPPQLPALGKGVKAKKKGKK